MYMAMFNGSVAVFGCLFTFAFGGWSQLFGFFLLAITVDYITGIAASLKEKKGLNSEVGFWGLAKKVFMLMIIALAHQMDIVFETNLLMTGALYYYLANELLSITENYGRIGLPLPDFIRKAIEVLKNK